MTDESPDYAPQSKTVSFTRWMMTRPSSLLSPCTPPHTSCKTSSFKRTWISPVIAVAKSIEITQQKAKFMKSNPLQQSTHKHTLDAIAKQQHQQYQPRPLSDRTSNKYNTSGKQRTIKKFYTVEGENHITTNVTLETRYATNVKR